MLSSGRMPSSQELQRDWFFTPGAEWIAWACPHTGKYKGFRVILTDAKQFLEWSEADGLAAGKADDGERPGRAKMTAVLEARRGAEREVAGRVKALVESVRDEPPRLHGVPVVLPGKLLQLILDVVEDIVSTAR